VEAKGGEKRTREGKSKGARKRKVGRLLVHPDLLEESFRRKKSLIKKKKENGVKRRGK